MKKDVVLRQVKDLIPYINNPRTHSDEQIAIIAASIKEFGWTNPVLTDGKNGIIAGHGRVLAARKLGLADIPCIELSHLTDAQRKAYVIADNQTAIRAGWDDELLRLEIAELKGLDFDLDLLGFETDDLAKLLADPGNPGLTDPDEVPETPAVPVTATGDLWVLGKHRLLCGDSTEKIDVERLLGDVRPHLMVTDPPYGVEYDPKWMVEASKAGKIHRGTKTRGTVSAVSNDDRSDWSEAWSLFPGNIAYVWHASLLGGVVGASLEKNKFSLRSQIIWAKDSFTISRGDYHWQHESCLYAVKDTGYWTGNRSQSTLWQIPKIRSETGHSTQKPVECMKRPIENNSSIGQAVYEPFSGSGTTIIAAEMTGRSCYAIEIEPAYVDVAVERWQKFTGQQGTLNGKTFEEVKEERQKQYDRIISVDKDQAERLRASVA